MNDELIFEHCGCAYVPDEDAIDSWVQDTHCSIECLAQANAEADELEPPK
jgi:hypothetical protein